MPITSVTYSRNFPIGPFLYETIGATITLGENQDPKEALSELNKLACEWNKQNNPHLEQAQPTEPEVLPIVAIQKETKQHSLEDDIRSCSEITVLKAYELLTRNKPSLREAYFETMEKLQKQIKKCNDTRIQKQSRGCS